LQWNLSGIAGLAGLVGLAGLAGLAVEFEGKNFQELMKFD
jgi:hypothetical protein